MKSNRLMTFAGVVLLLLVLSGAAILHAKNNINLGLDLRGGVYVLYQAVETGEAGGGDTIDRAITVIRNRIDSFGVAEPVIQQIGRASWRERV